MALFWTNQWEQQTKSVFLGLYVSVTRQVNPGYHSVYLHSAPYCPSGCSAAPWPLLQSAHSLHHDQHSSQYFPTNGDRNGITRTLKCLSICVLLKPACVFVCLRRSSPVVRWFQRWSPSVWCDGVYSVHRCVWTLCSSPLQEDPGHTHGWAAQNTLTWII